MDYPTPVTVNGYLCWNCTDVDHAHQHVDPAHPNAGPFGVDTIGAASGSQSPAVQLGGSLAAAAAPGGATPAYQPGSRLNVAA